MNTYLNLWIQNLLTSKFHHVSCNGTLSELIEINIGAPQGCVLSAVLFTIYTADCRSLSDKHVVIIYADDTVILGLISNDDDVNTYVQETNHFVNWCDDNFLNLNVKKTKEMFVDYSKTPSVFAPVNIKGENVEVVQEYKYLGNIIDDKLKGDLNVSQIHKKCNQRLYFLRKLKNVKVDCTILTLFYHPVCVIFLYFIMVW